MKSIIIILSLALNVAATSQPSNTAGSQKDDQLSRAERNQISHQIYFGPKATAANPVILKATIADPGDQFGSSMDISGDTLVIGAFLEDSASVGINGSESNNASRNSGAAYVFVKRDGNWQKQAYLKASNTEEADWFGYAVAIDGDTLAVGAVLEDSNATGQDGDQQDNSVEAAGAVYIFVRENNEWVQQAYLKPSNPRTSSAGIGDNLFGSALALEGDTLVVGVPNKEGNTNDPDNTFGPHTGTVYVFERVNGMWTETAYLKADSPKPFDEFGFSVDISGTTIVVGARGEGGNVPGVNGERSLHPRDNMTYSGAAFVFEKVEGTWLRTTYLKASHVGVGDQFGYGVAISGDTIVVGAPFEDGSSRGINGDEVLRDAEDAGAAYVFVRSEDSWVQKAYMKALNAEPGDYFGASIRMFGDHLFVGASNKAVGANDQLVPSAGAGYLFLRSNGLWNERAYFQDTQPSENDYFGLSVALSSDDLVIGAFREDSGAQSISLGQRNDLVENSGAAFAYELHKGIELQSGHSSLWFNPEQSGHGLSVYALEDNGIVVVWYVYDNEGRPLWLIGTGTHDGQSAVMDVQIASGGAFPPAFNPADVELRDWGQFEIAFANCEEGIFRWMPVADTEYTSGEMPIEKLAQTLGATCDSGDMATAQAKQLNLVSAHAARAAQSALWYAPEQPGHGFSVYMLEDEQVVAVWYVFDDAGNPLWLIGTGSFDGEVAELSVNSAAGAAFPPLFSADEVELTDWGTMELRFSDCESGVFSWAPNPETGFTSGELEVVRLTTMLGLGCEN